MQESPTLNSWTSLFLIAAVQGLFLSALLMFHKKGNRIANRLLGIYIFLFSLMIGYFVAYWSGYSRVNVHVNEITNLFMFLYGPLLYAYLYVLQERKLPKRFYLHFVPFALQILLYAPFFIQEAPLKRMLIQSAYSTHGVLSYIMKTLITLWMLSMVTYAIAMMRLLKRDSATLNRFAILEEKMRNRWMRLVVLFFSTYVLSEISYFILAYGGWLKWQYDYGISFAQAAFIYLVGYLGFRQPELFHTNLENAKPKEQLRYQRSSLKEDVAKNHLDQLIKVMREEKPYVDSELKIQQLAEKIGISSHHLSQVINEYLNQNYADFINTYRINEAKRLLTLPKYDNAKILHIAFDVGYNNKATFNAAFKKITGMSPTDFRNKNAGLNAELRIDNAESN